MITMDEIKPETSARDYWLSFNFHWIALANEAYATGQLDMGHFFDELADDAADVWAGYLGPLDS